MANLVGGPPNGPPPNPDQPPQDNAGGGIGSIFRRIFSRNKEAAPPPPSFSSQVNQQVGVSVSAGGIDLSDKEAVKKELKAWKHSLPFWGIGSDANKIEEYLLSINLAEPFEFVVNTDWMKDIPSLPNVFKNCTYLDCGSCRKLRSLPQLPNCTYLECSGCSVLQILPALPACIQLNCYGCTNLHALPELPVCTRLYCYDCPDLETLPALPNCRQLNCSGCTRLQTLPELTSCTRLYCFGCRSLQELPALPACIELDCLGCTNLKVLLELTNCRQLYCAECLHLETLPALPACIELDCYGCRNLQTLPVLPACTNLKCTGCRSLRALPELSNCTYLECCNCPNLEAVLLLRDGFQVYCKNSPKVVLFEFVDTAKCEIEGVRYLPKALPEELKVLLTPPLPESASIDHLNSELETFIKGLKESDLPTLKKESPGQEDLASYKQKLTEWKKSLFSSVQGKLAVFGAPNEGTEDLKKFYEKIEYYLLHLDAFLSKEENRDALIERLRILQTQSACGARFIAELEQLFSMNCIGGETADLSNQFAQIASTEAKLAIERMFPGGNVHPINQAMFQLKDYLTGSYFKDHLSSEMHQGELILKFLKNHTSVNLVKTIQNGLKPNSPLEELFTQYLKENFSPELSQEQLKAVIDDVDGIWKDTKERKIAAFETYDLVRQKPAKERTPQEKLQMAAPILTQDEKACQNKEELEGLLKSKEKSFKDKNIQSGVESKKDEILYQEHFDEEQNRWKPGIIAQALQKMGILATEAELFPKANYPSF